VGGFLTEHVTWRAIFYINPPVAAIAVAVVVTAGALLVGRKRGWL